MLENTTASRSIPCTVLLDTNFGAPTFRKTARKPRGDHQKTTTTPGDHQKTAVNNKMRRAPSDAQPPQSILLGRARTLQVLAHCFGKLTLFTPTTESSRAGWPRGTVADTAKTMQSPRRHTVVLKRRNFRGIETETAERPGGRDASVAWEKAATDCHP